MCFMTSDDFTWLPWQHYIKKKMNFLNDSSSKTTVSSVANFITAYEESKRDSHFLIRNEFFVSKGNLFDGYYISLPLCCLHI